MPPKKKSGKGKKSKAKANVPHAASNIPLTQDEIAVIRKSFNSLAKGKGAAAHIKLDQLGFVMRAAGGVPSEEELKNKTDEIMTQGKTTIFFPEFLEILVDHRNKHGFLDQELSTAFEIIDADCSGYIEAKELVKLLTEVGDPLTDKEADELVKEADFNHDGKIDYLEFVSMTYADAKLGFGDIFAGGPVRLKSAATRLPSNPPPPAGGPSSLPPPVPSARTTASKKVIIKAEAEFDYDADQPDELSFAEGDIITVFNKEIYHGWAEGEHKGKRGVFPNNFVRFFEEVNPVPKPLPPLASTGIPPPSAGPPSTKPPSSGLPFNNPPCFGPPPTSGPPSTKLSSSVSALAKPPTYGPPSSIPPNSGPPPIKPPNTGPPSIKPPNGEPPSITPPSSGLPSTKPPSSEPPSITPPSSGLPSTKPPSSVPPPILGSSRLEVDDKTRVNGMTAQDLTQFALQHKHEFAVNGVSGAVKPPGSPRSPVNPESVLSVAEVKAKLRQVPSDKPPQLPQPTRKASLPPTPVPVPSWNKDLPGNRSSSNSADREESKTNLVSGNDINSEEIIRDIMERVEDRFTEMERQVGSLSKLISVLQNDLDEEINHRKQLETEIHRMKRMIDIMK